MHNELDIKKLHEMLIKGEITSEELVGESLEKSKEIEDKCNAFALILDDAKGSKVTDNLLSGIPYGIKDNYSTKDIESCASSNTLTGYVPFFDATVIEKLKKAGAVATNKTAMDEFGMGGTGTTAKTGVIRNPWDTRRMCAGSSSGSAAAVAAGVYPYALGSDTGDSIRKPAAYCGIVGYKPTYGMISRYGLFPFASSLDHCGVLTRNVADAAIVTDVIKGQDEKDMTSWDSSNMHLYENLKDDLKTRRLCYVKEIVSLDNYETPSEELKTHLNNFMDKVNDLRSRGITVDEVSVDKTLLDAVASCYVVISCAEATSNMSNLTGINFGPRGCANNIYEAMKDHRTKGFSPLIKRRFVIGSYVLQRENQDKYFNNAKRVRRLIVNKWKELFKDYDAVILPVGSGPAPFLEKSQNTLAGGSKILEEHLQIGNFGGFPSITIPDGFVDNLPVGLNITGDCYNDQTVLNIAYGIEKTMDYKNQIAKEVSYE